MQTFVVLLVRITFGYKIGIMIITLYLFEGMVGLPVLQDFQKKELDSLFCESNHELSNWFFICCIYCRFF